MSCVKMTEACCHSQML